MNPWLARLRHDLVKHAAWRARDLDAALAGGEPLRAGDVAALRRAIAELPDGAGRAVGLVAAWRGLRDELEEELPGELLPEARGAVLGAVERFEGEVAGLVAAMDAVTGDDATAARRLCALVLSLEGSADRLAHDMNKALAA